MNISQGDLRRDFARARAWWGGLIDDTERRHGIPARLLYAVYSRETNLGRHWRTAAPASWPARPSDDDLTYFIRNAGDGGHGRGIGQVDDRSHAIPDDWSTNIAWQVDRSAEILGGYLATEGGDVVRGANRYNSGQGETSGTTDKDYGPDVTERWQVLVRAFPPEEAPMPDGNRTAEKALQFLRDNLGLGEDPPGSNHNWISEWYGMIGAWCAMTMSRALIAAGFGTEDRIDVPGLTTTSAKGWAYVPYLHHDFAAAGRYDRNPVVGDLVIFDWDGDGEGDHVGMLEEIVDDGTFLVLEGNTDAGVLARKRRPLSVINGFCHPPYSPAATTPELSEEDDMPIFGDAPDGRDGGLWMIFGGFRKRVHTPQVWDDYQRLGAKHIGDVVEDSGGKFPVAMFDGTIDIEAALAARIVVTPGEGGAIDTAGVARAVADEMYGRLAG